MRGRWSTPVLQLLGHSKVSSVQPRGRCQSPGAPHFIWGPAVWWPLHQLRLACTQPVVAVRFCPLLFQRDGPPASPAASSEQAPRQEAGGAATALDLPYKMVFAVSATTPADTADGSPGRCSEAPPPWRRALALPCVLSPVQVATLDSVVLYDTQSLTPLAALGHLHYDSITDLAWSPDSRLLAVSSRDCYCRCRARCLPTLLRPAGCRALHCTARRAALRCSSRRTALPAALRRHADGRAPPCCPPTAAWSRLRRGSWARRSSWAPTRRMQPSFQRSVGARVLLPAQSQWRSTLRST